MAVEQPKRRESTAFMAVECLKVMSNKCAKAGDYHGANTLLNAATALLQHLPEYERKYINSCIDYHKENDFLIFDNS